METVQIREAKAGFSALVAAAEKGRPTLVSRHGQPCAMIVPVADGARLERPQHGVGVEGWRFTVKAVAVVPAR